MSNLRGMIIEGVNRKNATDWQRPAVFFVFLVFVTFIGAQFITVQHSHDGELTHQVDCSTCAKNGIELDFLDTKENSFPFLGGGVTVQTFILEIVSSPIPFVNSRSPPIT